MCVHMYVFVAERESCVNICLKIVNVPKLSSLHNSFSFSLEGIKILYVFYAQKQRIKKSHVYITHCVFVLTNAASLHFVIFIALSNNKN